MWRMMPGPSMSASTTRSPGCEQAVRRALAAAVRGTARAARAGEVLERDRPGVEARIDDGRVGGGAIDHRRLDSAAVIAWNPSVTHGRSAGTSSAIGALWNSFAHARRGRSVSVRP